MLYIEKGKNRLLVIAVIKIHSVITIKALNLGESVTEVANKGASGLFFHRLLYDPVFVSRGVAHC